jgi:hypothetical protein
LLRKRTWPKEALKQNTHLIQCRLKMDG